MAECRNPDLLGVDLEGVIVPSQPPLPVGYSMVRTVAEVAIDVAHRGAATLVEHRRVVLVEMGQQVAPDLAAAFYGSGAFTLLAEGVAAANARAAVASRHRIALARVLVERIERNMGARWGYTLEVAAMAGSRFDQWRVLTDPYGALERCERTGV